MFGKNYNKLLWVVALLITSFSYSQSYTITGLHADSNYNVTSCDSIGKLNFWFGQSNTTQSGADIQYIVTADTYVAGPITAVINWGDGTSSTHQGQTSSFGSLIQFTPNVSHAYNTANSTNYPISVFINNPSNNSYATDSNYVQVYGCNSWFYGNIALDCDGDGTIDSNITNNVPFNLSSGGSSYSGVLMNNQAVINNIPPGNYSLSLSQAWLSNNGYNIHTQTPLMIMVQNNGQYTFQFVLHCDSVPNQQSCVNGMVFCDTDSNGVFNGNDSPYSNVQVNITAPGSGNSSFGVFTNANEVFQYSGPYLADSVQVNVDSGWLMSHGMWNPGQDSVVYTVSTTCGTNNFLYIPLDCDSTSPPPNNNGCVQGIVYCDANGNGMLDSTEVTIPNAPIHVQYQNQNYVGQTNPNGYYNISFPNANQGAAVVSVSQWWLSQNGYNYTGGPQTTTVTQCSAGNNYMVNFGIDCDSAQVQNECVGGTVFCDGNGNGIQDSSEIGIPNAPIVLQGQNGSVTVYTNNNGIFFYSGNSLGGTYAIAQINQNWLAQHGYTVTPQIVTVNLDCNNGTPIYFAVDCNNSGTCADMWTTVNPWIGYYQNQTNYIKLKWGNHGPGAAQSYTLTLTFPSGVTPVTSTILYSNYVISGNTITWTFTSGSSYFNYSDVIGFQVPPGIPSGTQHTYSSTISPTGNNQDCCLSNNQGSLMMIVGNSYDPNDKNVNMPPIINPNVQDELTYVVRFQNTGTAPAQDIYILDTLSANLDLSTFEVMESSHNMQVIDLGNGIMKFNFPGIWLPDSTANEPASHGQFTYKIKEKSGNGIGVGISNTAHIFFDWNPAIITNTTYNENNVLGIYDLDLSLIKVYPNPAKDDLTILSEIQLDKVQLVDMAGKVIISINNFKAQTISLQNVESGVYLLQLSSGGTSHQMKVIKQ